MLTFQGKLKLLQERKLIASSVINWAIEPVTLIEYVTHRDCEVGFSSHQAYTICTASGAKSKITRKYIYDIWNIGLETARRTLMIKD